MVLIRFCFGSCIKILFSEFNSCWHSVLLCVRCLSLFLCFCCYCLFVCVCVCVFWVFLMARALGTGGITSTSPFFFASVSCYSPDGLVLHRPKHVPAFLRSQFLTRIQRPSSRVLALAPSALYYPSLSSSFCVRMPRSAACLRLGLAVLHGFGLPAAAQGRLPRDSAEAAGASTRCMAASTEKDLETWIRKTNSSQPIVVWSKTYCP